MIKIFLKPIALMLATVIAVIVIISTFGANKRIPEDANKGESALELISFWTALEAVI